jgi:uncharacterized delta-60 repeat protein
LFLALAPVFDSLAASPGSLDTSFAVGSTGYGENVVLVQPDSQVIIAGAFTYYHNVWRQSAARLNSDASLDLTFDPSNNVAGNVTAGSLLSDGRIVLAGGFTIAAGAQRNRVARLNNDGTLDPSFDPGAGPNNDVRCLAIQPDGKLVLGGTFTSIAGQPANYIARLNSDGSVDTNFVASADYFVDALAIQPDGRLIVGGWFSHLAGAAIANIARLNTHGTLDPSFVTSVNEPVETIAVQPDGKLLIGGYFAFSTGAQVGRLTPSGAWDSGFTPGVNGSVYVVHLQDDGKVLIGGTFSAVNGGGHPYLARLYSDGTTDTSFNAGPDNLVDTIAFQPDGRIIIAGGFGYVEGVNNEGLARLYSDDRTAAPIIELNGKAFRGLQSDAGLPIPLLRSGNTNTSVSVQYATSDLDAQAGSDYVATAGTLTFAPGEVSKTITVPLLNDGQVENFEQFGFSLTNPAGAIIGSASNAVATVLGVNNVVQFNTPDIFTNELAGTLSVSVTRVGTNIASAVLCQTVDGTALAGTNYNSLAQLLSFAPGQATTNVTLTLLDDALPGPDTSFSLQLTSPVNTQLGPRSNLTVTILDNDAPGHPAFGLNGSVSAVSATADGAVVLGGNFISINGTPRAKVGKVHADESLDSTFDPGTGADASVSAVLVQPDTKIICGGSFRSFNGISRARLMRLNGDGSLDTSFDPGTGPASAVTCLALSTNGAFFAGGFFTSYAGTARLGVAKINADGTLDINFVPQLQPAPATFDVLCLATQSGASLLVGSDGFFGFNTNICVRLNPDGSRDASFTNKITGLVTARISSLVPQPDGKILVAGLFNSVNGVPRNNIARLNTNGSLDGTFNPANGASSSISKLMLLDNGQLMAVGGFTSYAGVPRGRIVRINSDGTLDPSFNPGSGADSAITDLAPLPGNKWAVGGTFRNFSGFPRYNFAVLDSTGQLLTRIRFETFGAANNLQFGMVVEPETPFRLLASSDLVNWQVIYSNFFHLSFTNLVLPGALQDKQFFRALQAR